MSGYILTIGNRSKTFSVTLDENNNAITIPAGSYVLSIVIKPKVDEILKVSDVTEGGTDIEADFPVYAEESGTVEVNKFYDVETIIYVTGNVSEMTATIYIL